MVAQYWRNVNSIYQYRHRNRKGNRRRGPISPSLESTDECYRSSR
jgi:hypothetical protein